MVITHYPLKQFLLISGAMEGEQYHPMRPKKFSILRISVDSSLKNAGSSVFDISKAYLFGIAELSFYANDNGLHSSWLGSRLVGLDYLI